MTNLNQGVSTLTPEEQELLSKPVTADELAQLAGLGTEQQYLANLEREVIRNPNTGRVVQGPDGPDDALVVQFSTQAVWNKMKSLRLGRDYFEDREFVSIYAPSQKATTTVHKMVEEFDKWRFPKEYAAFKSGNSLSQVGTSLAVWTPLTPSQRAELTSLGITSVEQLAALPDSTVGPLRGYLSMRHHAKAFLARLDKANNEEAINQKFEAERLARLEEKDKHSSEMEEMRKQLEALTALIKEKHSAPADEDQDESVEEAPKRKSYYKKKAAAE